MSSELEIKEGSSDSFGLSTKSLSQCAKETLNYDCSPPRKHVPVLWAQVGDRIYVTISLEINGDYDIKVVENQKESMSSLSLVFTITGKDKVTNSEDLELWGDVDPSTLRVNPKGRYVEISLMTKEKHRWPRLIKNDAKCSWIKIDWSKWTEEAAEVPDEIFPTDDPVYNKMTQDIIENLVRYLFFLLLCDSNQVFFFLKNKNIQTTSPADLVEEVKAFQEKISEKN
jgi:hypothetical protein